ncbi:MAG: class I SAM-dependent methyltransferase [Phycisphaerales bacterium]|nr:class I SAM-dependent methyltransferase [Phycisphaerales bacterium]
MHTASAMSRKKKNRNKGKKQKPKGPPQASVSDRHVLYQQSVQNVEAEIDFVDDTFKALRGRHATLLREDFCGTAHTSCEWIKRRATNRAIGVDLDSSVLEWGTTHNLDVLDADARGRVTLERGDVTTIRTEPVDIVLAMNFSYFCFKSREALRGYFKNVLRSLADGGMLIMDCYGGAEAHLEQEEERDIDGDFTYVWDQAKFDPISSHMICHIHFHFDDGSKMRKAFSYDWRMWSLPEIRELLEEAGFKKSTVYWEGTDEEEEEGNGEFTAAEEGEADPAWIAYIVAEK